MALKKGQKQYFFLCKISCTFTSAFIIIVWCIFTVYFADKKAFSQINNVASFILQLYKYFQIKRRDILVINLATTQIVFRIL
jgi:hypothetical protein